VNQMCHNGEDWCFHLSLSHFFSLSRSHTLISCRLLAFTTYPSWCGTECAKPSSRSAVNTHSAPPKPRDEIWQQMSQRSKTAVVFTTSQIHSVFLNYDNAKQCHPNHRGCVYLSLSPPIERVETPLYEIISFQRLSDKNVSGSTKNTR